MPETEAKFARANLAAADRDVASYEEWLRSTTTLTVETEINLQLGDLTLKKHRVQVLDRQIAELPDFREVFVATGRGAESSAIACAEVAVTSQRRWLRLLGRRHDVRLWTTPDPRPVEGLHAGGGRARRYPEQLDANAEAWIRAALQEHTGPGGQLGGFAITLPAAATPATAPFVVLGGELSFTPAGGTTITAMKEIVVLRSPPSVQVFDVVEHGRRWYRTLAWVTDSSLTLYDTEHDAVSKRGMDPAQRSKLPPTWPTKIVYDRARGGLRIEAGDARRYLRPAHSLVITRHLNAALGRQVRSSVLLFDSILSVCSSILLFARPAALRPGALPPRRPPERAALVLPLLAVVRRRRRRGRRLRRRDGGRR